MGYPATAALKTKVGTWEQTADAYLYLGPRDNMTRVATRLIWRVLPTETSFAQVEDHFPATSRGAAEIRWQGASPCSNGSHPPYPRCHVCPHSIEMADCGSRIALARDPKVRSP